MEFLRILFEDIWENKVRRAWSEYGLQIMSEIHQDSSEQARYSQIMVQASLIMYPLSATSINGNNLEVEII